MALLWERASLKGRFTFSMNPRVGWWGSYPLHSLTLLLHKSSHLFKSQVQLSCPLLFLGSQSLLLVTPLKHRCLFFFPSLWPPIFLNNSIALWTVCILPHQQQDLVSRGFNLHGHIQHLNHLRTSKIIDWSIPFRGRGPS